MNNWAIQVENLGKRYLIRHQVRHPTLRHTLTDAARSLLRKRRKLRQPSQEEFWALKDIAFEVKSGERLGVIGRNGAGKSTLLKLLSRITEPTTGQIRLRGRVASLLEVGTGFHPELTGRENIFLNGSILGMQRHEITKKFDEIVDFAGVERFLDTPVKRYSSGMYVRLAFAIAAHLEPEILIVDEVLAVGDVRFQQRCLGKIKTIGQAGRTVIFVSHQMGIVSQLCDQAMLLDQGILLQQGATDKIIDAYLNLVSEHVSNRFNRNQTQQPEVCITRAETLDAVGHPKAHFTHQELITVEMHAKIPYVIEGLTLSVSVKDAHGRKVFTVDHLIPTDLSYSQIIMTVLELPKNFLTPGNYSFLMTLHIPNVHLFDVIDEICPFTIADAGSISAMYDGKDYGCVFATCKWQFFN